MNHRLSNNIISTAIAQSEIIVLITNLEGEIVYASTMFYKVTGYMPDEVIGQNPRFLKSEFTSNEEYTDMWINILGGRAWKGDFKNKKKMEITIGFVKQ